MRDCDKCLSRKKEAHPDVSNNKQSFSVFCSRRNLRSRPVAWRRTLRPNAPKIIKHKAGKAKTIFDGI